MEAEKKNYGITEEPGPEQEPAARSPIGQDQTAQDRIGGPGPTVLGTREEKTWSVLAHLSTFLNMFTIFLGPVAALVVWLVFKDRSRKVAFEALQSAAYQGAWLAILGVGWALTALLTIVLIGFLLIPAMLVLTLVPFAHAAYAAYRVSKDGEYRYPLIADFIENR